MRGTETILVVDDADAVRRMVSAMLRNAGYQCLEAGDGVEGLDIFSRESSAVDLLLTDVMMPKMGGHELARRVTELRPDLRVLFMSGFTDDPIVRSLERSPSMFLPKPFTAGVLMEKIRSALDTPWQGLPAAP